MTAKKTGSPKAQKTAARLAAVQTLYQMRLNNQDAKSVLREFTGAPASDGEKFVSANREMLDDIVSGVEDRAEDIDAIISKTLSSGGREKVETLLDCILRAGVYELIADAKTDAGIIINDYLNVTAGFYDGSETKIVNAVLDKVAKSVRG